MPKLTEEQIAKGLELTAPGPNQLSIAEAARRVGASAAGLRYHVNGRNRRSGVGHEPLPDDQRDPLADSPSLGSVPVIPLDYSKSAALKVYPLGDVHVGSPAHEASKWQEWLDFLAAQDDVSIILTGDLFNAALKDSKSETYDETMTVGAALGLLREQLEPVKDKIDLMIPGNHEERVYRAAGIEPVGVLADMLGVPYARKVALLHYTVGVASYQVYLRHGTGMNGGGGLGSKLNALERAAKAVRADIYLSGHTHVQTIARDRVFEVGADGEPRWRRRLFLGSGSFVGYEEYAAERAFVAGDIGAPRIRLDGTRRDAHASL